MLDRTEAVIFDLDGTLVDSMWMWREIDIEYLGRFGIPLPEELQSCIEGMSFSETANYFQARFPEITDSIEEMKSEWTRMAWDKYVNEVPLKPGALEFLQLLRKRNIKTGIATSNSPELVWAVLKSLSAEQYFDEVHTACEVGAGKPSPDIYLLVADCLQVAPERCLVFEDISKGIQAGQAAGRRVWAVRDEYSLEDEENKAAQSDYFIDSYLDLRKR
ncbi:MAG: HAD family phosphatase [Lachnospiraceae bacterium]|nr:HAD family phosphatase [Lachnospiraceae bacterium]